MNSITQHIPGFVSGYEPETQSFNSLDDLLTIDFVKRFKQDDFFRYSISNNALIAEYDKGNHFWVVGFIEDPNEIDLPQWTYPATNEKDIPWRHVDK